jgi:RHS repeat-associated protein
MNTMTLLTGSDRMNSVVWRSDAPALNYTPSGTPDADTPGDVGFHGERRDPVSGTTHLGNGYRAYSPVLMRFTCPDSLSPFGAGGINPYAYCAGDPVNRADPSGHMSWQAGIGIGLGILGIMGAILTAGSSIAAAGGIMAAIAAASPTALVGGAAGILSDAAAMYCGAMEDNHPQKSSVLGWVSLGFGVIGGGIAFRSIFGQRETLGKLIRGEYMLARNSDVLESYQSTGFDFINSYLRRDRAPIEGIHPGHFSGLDESISDLQKEMNTLPRYYGIAWRGTQITQEAYDHINIGDIIFDKAFSSFSEGSGIARGFATGGEVPEVGLKPLLFKARFFGGGRNIVGHTMQYFRAEEKEILSPPGLCFKVASKSTTTDGTLTFGLREIFPWERIFKTPQPFVRIV